MPKTHSAAFRAAESLEETTPAYLYIFEVGEAPDLVHLTNSDEGISVTNIPAGKGTSPQVFESAQVKHTSINQETEISAPTVDVAIGLNTAGFTDDLRQYMLRAVPETVKVTIVRVNSVAIPAVDWDNDIFVVFKGVATAIGFNSGTIQVSFQSLLLQMDGQVPRYYYQKTCQHMLGGTLCGVVMDVPAFRIATTLSAVDQVSKTVDITETTLDGLAIDSFTFQGGKIQILDGGLLVVDTVAVMACRALSGGSGTRLYLLNWSPTIAAAVNVKAFRSCQRTVSDCENVFNNLGAYGGTPYVPDFSPAVHGIRS